LLVLLLGYVGESRLRHRLLHRPSHTMPGGSRAKKRALRAFLVTRQVLQGLIVVTLVWLAVGAIKELPDAAPLAAPQQDIPPT
jgi:hypothetical protein